MQILYVDFKALFNDSLIQYICFYAIYLVKYNCVWSQCTKVSVKLNDLNLIKKDP